MPKVKILYTIGYYSIGGKERQLYELISNLDISKYHIGLIYSKGNAFFINDIVKKVSKAYCINICNYFSFLRAVYDFNPDIICTLSRPTAYFTLFTKFIFRKKFRIINMSIQGAPEKRGVSVFIHSILYNFYNIVVANTYAGLKAYNQHNKKGRYVLYNGFTFNRIPVISKTKCRENINLHIEKNDFIISMVGGLKKSKDHFTLLDSFRIFNDMTTSTRMGTKKDYKCSKLLIVGDGPNKNKIINYIKNNSIDDVYLLGNRPDVEMILKASDLSVLCSTNGEGIANVVLESLACKTPVIATESEGIKEIILNNVNGFTIPPRNSKKLAKILYDIYTKKGILKKLSINCIASIEKFSISNMLDSYEKIIRICLHK